MLHHVDLKLGQLYVGIEFQLDVEQLLSDLAAKLLSSHQACIPNASRIDPTITTPSTKTRSQGT